MKTQHILSALAVVAATGAFAEVEREPGVRLLNNRLTLRPYLSFSYTYDSNIDSSKHSKSGSQWIVNPAVDLAYAGDNWKLDGSVWYQYHAYNRYTSQLNESSYGERLRATWQNSAADEAGWSASFVETFQQIAQDDDMSNHNGRGIGRDRMDFTAEGVVERRINERVHASVTANYYYLDYDNDVDKYARMYGWKRASAGAQAGYVVNRWTDLILAANYQWYWQDNNRDHDARWRGDETSRGRHISGDSRGWSVMAGVSTRATEKLSYSILGGWSRFEYGGGAKSLDGWTYSASADWQADVENTLHFMALASSYYQPSEREYGSALKTYNFSFGAAKGLIRNALRATFDISYRKETHEYVEYKSDDYDSDIWTARVGLTYRINTYASVYTRLEYQTYMAKGGSVHNNAYDYDRWRGTVGFSLTY